jgi:Cu+-exporting ATPase
VVDCVLLTPRGKVLENLDAAEDKTRTGLLFNMLLSAESRSGHPIAKGIAEYSSSRLVELSSMCSLHNEDSDFEGVTGKGVRLSATDGNGAIHTVVIGSADMLEAYDVELTPAVERLAHKLRSEGKIVVFAGLDGYLAAVLGLGDAIRPEAKWVLEFLRKRGIECYMVTGDNLVTAQAIAASLEIPTTNILAGASPGDKEKYVANLQLMLMDKDSNRGKVAFVGDGTNDTPALSQAHVGLVMSSGTDLALECGDIVLCKANEPLEAIATAIDLSDVTMRRIYYNYFWALVYNSILIPIAAGVLLVPFGFKLNPIIAGGAMAISSVSVVLSSLCLSIYKPPTLGSLSSSRTEYRHLDDFEDEEFQTVNLYV